MTEQEYYNTPPEGELRHSEEIPLLATILPKGIFCCFTKTKEGYSLTGPEGQQFECASPVSELFNYIKDGFCIVGYLKVNEEGMPKELEKELLLSGRVGVDNLSFTVLDFLLMPLKTDAGILNDRMTRFWSVMFELAGAFKQEDESVPHHEMLKASASITWKDENKKVILDVASRMGADRIIFRNNTTYGQRSHSVRIKGELPC